MDQRMEVDHALEPSYSPDAPVRVAWLDVDRTDLGRGYLLGTPDPAATQSITLHEEYYSKAEAIAFLLPLDAKIPRTEVRRLSPALNMERLILPLSCSLDVNSDPGSLRGSGLSSGVCAKGMSHSFVTGRSIARKWRDGK